MDIFRIAAIAVTGVACAVLLRRDNGEYAVLVSIATILVILLLILPSMSQIISVFGDLTQKTGLDTSLFKSVIKLVGIGYITEFAAGLAEDAKENGIARNVNLAGKVAILVAAMPIIVSVIDSVERLLR